MTDKVRHAAEIALKVLEEWRNHDTVEAMHIFETITVPETLQALRQALADPISMTASELADRIKRGEKWKIAEPDTGIDRGAWDDVPDATKWVDELRGNDDLEGSPNFITDVVEREWVGLTDEEIEHIWDITKPDYEDKFDFPRAIEAALKSKNGF